MKFNFFLEKLSKIKNINIKINKNNDKKLAAWRSSKINQELYIPVVKVEIPKKLTVPKSAKVSIATKLKPTKIAGLAEVKLFYKNCQNLKT